MIHLHWATLQLLVAPAPRNRSRGAHWCWYAQAETASGKQTGGLLVQLPLHQPLTPSGDDQARVLVRTMTRMKGVQRIAVGVLTDKVFIVLSSAP